MSSESTERLSETEWAIRHMIGTATQMWAETIPVRIHRGGLEIGNAHGFISWADLDRARRDRGIGPEQIRQPQDAATGASAVFGKWPGDETEEELLRALEDLE